MLARYHVFHDGRRSARAVACGRRTRACGRAVRRSMDRGVPPVHDNVAIRPPAVPMGSQDYIVYVVDDDARVREALVSFLPRSAWRQSHSDRSPSTPPTRSPTCRPVSSWT